MGGRPLVFVEKDQKYQRWESVYGKVAMIALEGKQDTYTTVRQNDEILDLEKPAKNAYNRYLKSCTAPASESIRRAKELMQTIKIGVHPIYADHVDNTEMVRQEWLENIRNYKAAKTIFEVGVSKNFEKEAEVMKKHRNRIAKSLLKYEDDKQNLKDKHEENLKMKSSLPARSEGNELHEI